MNRLTQKIVSYFLERGYITENQVEWCKYVVEQKLCAAFLLPIMIGMGCLIAPIWHVIVVTTLIISKKPGNTGISRDIRTEFTTDLLLSD